VESHGWERRVSRSQIRWVPTGNLLVSITLSTGARFHWQETPEAWNRFEVPPEISSPDSTAASRTSLFAPLPILQDAGTPAGIPLPGSALRAGCRRVGGSPRPKAAGHDCRARRKRAEAARFLSQQLGTPLRAGRNCCRWNPRVASSQRAHPQGMLVLWDRERLAPSHFLFKMGEKRSLWSVSCHLLSSHD